MTETTKLNLNYVFLPTHIITNCLSSRTGKQSNFIYINTGKLYYRHMTTTANLDSRLCSARRNVRDGNKDQELKNYPYTITYTGKTLTVNKSFKLFQTCMFLIQSCASSHKITTTYSLQSSQAISYIAAGPKFSKPPY